MYGVREVREDDGMEMDSTRGTDLIGEGRRGGLFTNVQKTRSQIRLIIYYGLSSTTQLKKIITPFLFVL